MRAGGLSGEIKLVRIAAETGRVLVYPDDSALDLIRHDADVAASRFHIDEIERDVVRASTRDVLGCEVEVLRRAITPGTAMGENEHRRVRLVGAENVELLDICRAVGAAFGVA